MAKLPSLILKLLFGVFFWSLLQITSTHHLSVDPGKNITLHCNISSSEILWYRLRSEEVNLMVSAKKWKVKKSFLASYNADESHFDITQSSSSVNLVIIGVGDTDLGFYFCGGRVNETYIQFGKLIILNFTDEGKTDISSQPVDTLQSIGVELWITVCVCLVSVLINLIFMCVFCCRLKGKSVSSCSCCSNTTDTPEKEQDIHYATIQLKRRSKTAAKKNAASYPDSVTYATVASQPRRH